MPALISQHDPDFILHIGVAGGRDCYSLETRAHRDGYRIKDVDDTDGFSHGESLWKKEGVPDVLLVGWDEADVLSRWERGVEAGLNERGFLGPVPQTNSVASTSTTTTTTTFSSLSSQANNVNVNVNSIWGPGTTAANVAAAVATARAQENRRRGVVKLSRDAGRFLCEYALFESLSVRWLDAHRYKHPHLHPHLLPEADGHALSTPEAKAEAKAEAEAEAAPSLASHQDSQSSITTSTSTTFPSQATNEFQSQSNLAPEGQASSNPNQNLNPGEPEETRKKQLALERLGKVAFLHVPGWTGVEDINRGVLIAEEAIRALVASWEDGFRRTVGGSGGGGIGVSAAAMGAPLPQLDGTAFTSQHSESYGLAHTPAQDAAGFISGGGAGGIETGKTEGINWAA
ncbi:hypothetical protein A1O1_05855 [Capronia coronata CBS 617.96]|uniref:Uncharacterized protein n=1 Tax=Capronia coronata CBS 617.96 TaxID=1182541 RepID=W9Y8D3_9EURO|nr:uncharacterized protein A1O1_05855 [Capronia coronata CBS 617.96]EXJ85491.1 hypothetical protein A1O1_05855 [Capronia coronata CBS 617.96]